MSRWISNNATYSALVMLLALSTWAEPTAYLGVNTRPVDSVVAHQLGLSEGMGLVVGYIDKESAAQDVLQPHDILQKLDDQLLVSQEQLAVLVRSHQPGDTVTLTVLRKGKPVEVQATLSEREQAESADPFSHRQHEWPHPRVHVFGPKAFSMDDTGASIRCTVEDIRERLEQEATTAGSAMSNEIGRIMEHVRESMEASHHGAGPRVHTKTITEASATVTLVDDDLTVTLTADGADNKHLTARKADGTVLFDGPVNTDEERAKMPAEVAELYEQIDVAASKIDIRISSEGADEEQIRLLPSPKGPSI